MRYLLLALLLSACAEEIPFPESEKAFAREFFGEAIDLDRVKFFYDDTGADLPYAQGFAIYWPRWRDCQGDPIPCRHWLVHELVHVWQWEHFGNSLEDHDYYDFELSPEQPLLAYEVEQQAAIVQMFYMWSVGYGEAGFCLDYSEDSLQIAERLYLELKNL